MADVKRGPLQNVRPAPAIVDLFEKDRYKRSDREKVSVSLWPNAPPNALASSCLAAAVIVDVKGMTRGNLGGGGVHEVVVLSAR